MPLVWIFIYKWTYRNDLPVKLFSRVSVLKTILTQLGDPIEIEASCLSDKRTICKIQIIFDQLITRLCNTKEYGPTELITKDVTSGFYPWTQNIPPHCTAPQESTAQYVLCEWSHFRISSTDSKVRTILYSIINNTTGKYCSVAFILILHYTSRETCSA